MLARVTEHSLLTSVPHLAKPRAALNPFQNVASGLRRANQGVVARRTFLTIVHQGYEGWRLSFGQNPVKLDPGLRIRIPIYHTIQVRLNLDSPSEPINIKKASRKSTCGRCLYVAWVDILDLKSPHGLHRAPSKTCQVLPATTSRFSYQALCFTGFGTPTMHASP